MKVKIHTTLGDITVRLYDQTPLHRDNFIKLVKEGYYNGTLFHRVIKDFMVQGGDPDSKGAPKGKSLGTGGPGYTVPAEIKPDLFHKRGALAAARQGDQVNPQRNSSGSQFYIVTGQVYDKDQIKEIEDQGYDFTDNEAEIYSSNGGTPWLDGGYTIFGQVFDGLDIVFDVQNVDTDDSDKPKKDVTIEYVKVSEYKDEPVRFNISDYKK
jgi:peptidyl-prolyl cis-trans isomerase B (cyclophilin B)